MARHISPGSRAGRPTIADSAPTRRRPALMLSSSMPSRHTSTPAPRSSPSTMRGRRRRTMFEHIVVPLDGSPLAESVLSSALALADATGAAVTLLQVVPPSREMLDYNLRYDATSEAEALERAGDALDERAKSLNTRGRCVRSY